MKSEIPGPHGLTGLQGPAPSPEQISESVAAELPSVVAIQVEPLVQDSLAAYVTQAEIAANNSLEYSYQGAESFQGTIASAAQADSSASAAEAARDEALEAVSRFSRNAIYLSASVILSDTDLSLDGTTTGANQSPALQAIFDKALEGPLHVICDVRCTGYFTIHSGTRLTLSNGCGIKLNLILLTARIKRKKYGQHRK